MFIEKSVSDFLDALASREPVPGGGSGAALGGALAAALISMVCNLTIGKKTYEHAQETMADLLKRSEALRGELEGLLEADTQVYGKVMAAHRQPRKTPEQRRAREAAMQSALKEAAEVPLSIAERCARIVDLALPAAQLGNQWAVTDAGAGVLLAEASMKAALLNGNINLSGIKDERYTQSTLARIATITSGKDETRERVLEIVRDRIGT